MKMKNGNESSKHDVHGKSGWLLVTGLLGLAALGIVGVVWGVSTISYNRHMKQNAQLVMEAKQQVDTMYGFSDAAKDSELYSYLVQAVAEGFDPADAVGTDLLNGEVGQYTYDMFLKEDLDYGTVELSDAYGRMASNIQIDMDGEVVVVEYDFTNQSGESLVLDNAFPAYISDMNANLVNFTKACLLPDGSYTGDLGTELPDGDTMHVRMTGDGSMDVLDGDAWLSFVADDVYRFRLQ